jgi:hypothetical protein
VRTGTYSMVIWMAGWRMVIDSITSEEAWLRGSHVGGVTWR